jgi:DNA polymerase-3 subunit gamma/tau
MTYRALARKYRSQHFGELIGQDVLVRTLSNAINNDRLHHAYLFTGIRGTGKTSTARILAKAINYAGPNGDKGPTIGPTNDCPICNAIAADQHPDVIEIDAASNTGVDDVRQIIENARYAPMQARYKVFIIDEVHMLSKNAFNALLKTLEEPPSHVVFMLATTEIRKVPVTILSRCQRFDLRRVDAPTLITHFQKIATAENITVDAEALQIIARAADGSVRDGLSLLDQAIAQSNDDAITGDMIRRMLGQGDRAGIAHLITHVLKGDCAPALDVAQRLHIAGADPLVMIEDILDGVHVMTRYKVAPASGDDASLSPALRDLTMSLSPQLELSTLARAWQLLLKAQQEIMQASQPMQAFEMAIIRMAYASTLPPLEELAKRGAQSHTTSQTAPASTPTSAPVPTAPVVLRAVMGGNSAAPMMATVEAIATTPATGMIINDLRHLVALCEEKNEPFLAADLYTNIRPVKWQQGKIEIAINKGASRDIVSILGKKLQEWTGQRWVIAVATTSQALSLSEQDRDSKNAHIAKAYDDPSLKSWRKHFPNLTITDLTE